MAAEYLPEFENVCLEDSYFLGLVSEGANLRFRCLFALTVDHAAYAAPVADEQHCYREGSILIEQASMRDWKPGKPTITQDLDGSFDLGSIELYRISPTSLRVVTEWFDASVEMRRICIELI